MDTFTIDPFFECLEPGHPVEVNEERPRFGAIGRRMEGVDDLGAHCIAARTDGRPHADMDRPCTDRPHEPDGLGDDPECQSAPACMHGCNCRGIVSPHEDRDAVRGPHAQDHRRIQRYDPVRLGKHAVRHFLGPDDPIGMDLVQAYDPAARQQLPDTLPCGLRSAVEPFRHISSAEQARHREIITHGDDH